MISNDDMGVLDHAQESQRRLAEQVAEMRVMLTAELDLESRLTKLVSESRDRRKRLEKVIDFLSGGEERKTNRDKNQWKISEKKVAQVWNMVRHRTEPFTANGLAADTPGLSAETTRRACGMLRDREMLRVAGRGRGGGLMLAVMPGASEQDYHGAA